MLTSRPDGSVDLHVPLPSVKVKIGNLETQADERGNYVLTGVPLGTNKIQLIKEDHVFYEKTIVIDQNQDSLNVEIEKNEAEFFQGFTNMQQQMMSQQGSVSVQAALPAQQRFYPEQPVPSYPGIGRGEMKIFDANNLVSCNKADKGIEDLDGYGDTADFPLNFSDCSISIRYGVMFAYNPVMYAPFYRSYNCVIESIQNGMDNSERNVYCNMKRKLAFPELEYHYNCSWFFGIEHSESMHAHQ
ncbi:hypothetical protein [Polycladomyces subterraneus]|uniref:Carboxypeptidase regulatory-like domain-containing protein n=1 Tax=Polycladomyces subterraneus TaxID=1016997 RepID=A0ABT8IR35_9BACL|nr:hypothetical protein [Polycladomyces subterraneus]MDN4595234.1 hypothetical protein [Polycladomyces subterraneus]